MLRDYKEATVRKVFSEESTETWRLGLCKPAEEQSEILQKGRKCVHEGLKQKWDEDSPRAERKETVNEWARPTY